jgi:hypothetical protein
VWKTGFVSLRWHGQFAAEQLVKKQLNWRPILSGDIVQFALDSQGAPRNPKKFKKCPSMNYPQFDPLFIWIL